jgi:hypothetical protein
MKIVLKLLVTSKSQRLHDAKDRCGSRRKAASHVPHIEQNEVARTFEGRPYDVLALAAQLFQQKRRHLLKRWIFRVSPAWHTTTFLEDFWSVNDSNDLVRWVQ